MKSTITIIVEETAKGSSFSMTTTSGMKVLGLHIILTTMAETLAQASAKAAKSLKEQNGESFDAEKVARALTMEDIENLL